MDNAFDLESIISISMIRTHTKTDDILHVTDEQLSLYRKAAFEACELYTGNLYASARMIVENTPRFGKPSKNGRLSKVDLKYPSADGIVYYNVRGEKGQASVEVGRRDVRLPTMNINAEGDCCNPCGNGSNLGASLTYLAGYKNPDDIPSGIKVGILKWIAWSVQNSGDVLLTMANTDIIRGQAIQGTNNTTWASGALELWRSYVGDGI